MTKDVNQRLIDAANAALAQHPEWRYGQAMFNAAYTLYPAAADQMRGGSLDPFHRDERAIPFAQKVAEIVEGGSA